MDESYIYFDDHAAYMKIPIYKGGQEVNDMRRLVMTKELFVKCYERWIKGEGSNEDDK